ncbi:MAG: T9SS type A sorting domain-containing protein, partial [Bacteroidia bacterium]
GYQYIGNTNSWRSYQNIMILDSLGNQPIRVQNVPLGAGLTDIIQTKDKKFVAVGAKTFSVDGYGDDVTHTYAVKFDINNPASPIWTKEGNSHAYGEYDCITELPDSSFLMGGDMDTVADHQITRIDKRDKNGNLLRSNFYDNSYQPITVSNEQFILCLNPTSDGGHVAAILNLNSSNNPYLFIKYDSSGCDSTLAYCAMLADGIRTLRLSGSLVSVYPNPCKSQLNIDLQNIEAAHSYNGSFYDVSGREAKLIKLEQATNKIDISELEDGLYLLKIENPATKMNYQIKVLKQN